MRVTISRVSLERIERIAKICRRDPPEVLDAAFALREDADLKLLPREKRTGYF